MIKNLFLLIIILVFITIYTSYYFQKIEQYAVNFQESPTAISDHIISDHNNVSDVSSKIVTTLFASSFLLLLIICLCCSSSIYFLTLSMNSTTYTKPDNILPEKVYYILSDPKELNMLKT